MKRHGPLAVAAKLLPITPGWNAAAATPSSPQRRSISFVNRMFESFALPYAELAEYRRSALRSSMSKREKRRAATLEVWMTAAPESTRRSRSRLVSRNAARWFVWKVASNPSTVTVRSPKMPPALFASTSMRG